MHACAQLKHSKRDLTYRWPQHADDDDVKSFVDKLLSADPEQRLGQAGAIEVMHHPWFKTVEWKAFMANPPAPPFTPQDKANTDFVDEDDELMAAAGDEPDLDSGTCMHARAGLPW